MHRSLAFLLLLAACSGPPSNDDDTTAASDDDDASGASGTFEIGDVVTCAEPTSGFDRLTISGPEHGIDLVYEPDTEELRHCPSLPGGMTATDLDGDGNLDLLFWKPDDFPHVYAGTGTGFEPRTIDADPGGIWVNVQAAVDVTGDGLPELFLAGPDGIGVAENLGDFAFTDVTMLYVQTGFPRACISTLAFGDVDGDNDLDIALPRLTDAPTEDWVISGDGAVGTTDLLLINDGGTWTVTRELQHYPTLGLSFLGVFTDRDNDGDLDLMYASEFGPSPEFPPTAFYRNDGPDKAGGPRLTMDAVEISADISISAMGFASHDLNFDGAMDYCISDIGPDVACLVSLDGEASYVESGLALGLVTTSLGDDCPLCWSQWSIFMEDLDGDGALDAGSVAGPPPDEGGIGQNSVLPPTQPDVIWQGDGDGGFIERTFDVGWGDPAWHYGLFAVDFFGDGAPEVVVGPWQGAPIFYDNPCHDGAWVTVDFVGTGTNVESYGARVEVEAGGVVRTRELHAVSGTMQSASELMFSLGAVETIDRVTVRWPDGESAEVRGLDPRRRVLALHPDAAR